MKGRLLIFLTVLVLVVVLVAINAASYVRVEEGPETELAPDRSTFNAGGTGTRALFDYLRGRGVDAVRWTQPISSLSSARDDRPASFVVVGETRSSVEKSEAEEILRWVAAGGRLVVIDRSPQALLLPASHGWHVVPQLFESPGPDVHPNDVEQMTRDVPLITPAQPTALTLGVKNVTRSRFASRLNVYHEELPPVAVGVGTPARTRPGAIAGPTPTPSEDEDPFGLGEEKQQPQLPEPSPRATSNDARPSADAPRTSEKTHESQPPEESDAPVIHIADGREGVGGLLVDYPYGRGRVVVLSDPYIVSNAGITRADNLFLAYNVVTGGRGGRVAFDEYHQGFGETQNEILAYFRGTPILWMFAQVALVALAVVWTRGRRFARPLPAPRADRGSKLEFVASMAELQQRARAYDLAIENIYTRTRRALARYGGLSAGAPLEQIAERVAARSGRDRSKLEALLRECEDSIAGVPLSSRRALELAKQLRELERDLGILMRSREIRQAADASGKF